MTRIPHPVRSTIAARFRGLAKAILSVVFFLGAAEPAISQPLFATPQFQANTLTDSDQSRPALASDAAGNFVVVWQSVVSGGSDEFFSIQAREFDLGGSAPGPELQVNTFTSGIQEEPAVARSPSGSFVVWQSAGSPGTDQSDFSIQGQRLDPDGLPVGPQFQVNSYTTGPQNSPKTAPDGTGGFVVVWSSYGSGETDPHYGVVGQRIDALGAPVGPEFQVNVYTTSFQTSVDVAADPSGNFVVVWQSIGSTGTDSSDASIQARRYDEFGVPLGSEFQVNSYTQGSQVRPTVAMFGDGGFVIAWDSSGSNGTDLSETSIQARRFDSDGAPVGGEFQVNTYTTSYQFDPSVVAGPDNGFLVAWTSDGSFDTDASPSIQAQYFDATGVAIGPQFQVNTYSTGAQTLAVLASSPSGSLVTSWQSQGSSGSDTSGDSVQVRRYCGQFCDGFESGDTERWSQVKSTPPAARVD